MAAQMMSGGLASSLHVSSSNLALRHLLTHSQHHPSNRRAGTLMSPIQFRAGQEQGRPISRRTLLATSEAPQAKSLSNRPCVCCPPTIDQVAYLRLSNQASPFD